MNFHIVDTQAIYRRLLATEDAATRESIFRQELIAPFQGVIDIFGGGDSLAAFRNWGMWPDQFTGDSAPRMQALIDTLAAHQAWERAAQALHKGWHAFAKYADRIPTKTLVFGLMLGELLPQAGGYSGFGSIPGWVMTIYSEATDDNLKKVEAVTVHELHHNIAAASGNVLSNWMTTSVGEYMVAEGLAESFAKELYGEDSLWVTRVDDSRLDHVRSVFRDALHLTGSALIRSYIFGTRISTQFGLQPTVDLPDYAGYMLGYKVVQAYLKRTGKTVADATFTPVPEIIAESCFFDE